MKELIIITRLNVKFTILCNSEQYESYMDDIYRVLDGKLNYCIFPCDNGEVTLPSDTLRSSIIKHS